MKSYHFNKIEKASLFSKLSPRPLLALALVAVAGLLLVRPAEAALVPNPQSGDIFLAFRASNGQGDSTAYLVNLGPDTLFRNAVSGSSFDVTGLGNLGADLAGIYGGNWHTRPDLHWAIFGVRNTASSTVYASRARPAGGGVSVSWPALDLNGRNGTATQITSVVEGTYGYKGRTATANSTVATTQPNASTASSYNYQVTSGATDFGSLSQWSTIEGNFAAGSTGTALDLYRIAGTTSTRLGVFSLSTAGAVHFTAATAAPVNVDTDGDGVLDSDEAIAGTNPNSASDFFRVQSLEWTSGGARVSFATAANRKYEIEYSETLAGGSWTVVGNHTEGGSASVYQFLDEDVTRRSKPRGFYRVKVSQ